MNVLIILIAVFGFFPAIAEDWPQYRGSRHDGSTSEKILSVWPESGLKPSWRTPTLSGFSSFAVAEGFAATQLTKDGNEALVVFSASTGDVKWSASLSKADFGHNGGNAGARGNNGGDGPRSTPSIDGGNIFVFSADFELFCFSLETGKIIWKKNLLADHKGNQIKWENAASPVVEGELIFVGGGGPEQSLLAFHKASGRLAWAVGTETVTHATPTVARIHGVKQVIFFCVSGLVSVETETGRTLWKQPYKFAVSTAASPIVDQDVVFCSAGYGVGGGAYKVSNIKGKWNIDEIWRIPGNAHVANHWSTPVLKDGHLYGMFSFKKYGDGPLKCVEIRTGKIKWEKEGFGAGNVIRVRQNILALTDYGTLVLVEGNSSAYKELARFKAVTGKCWSTPVVARGHIYVRSTKEGACLRVSP